MIFWVKPLSTNREAGVSIHSHQQIESEMCVSHHLKSQFHFKLKMLQVLQDTTTCLSIFLEKFHC